MVSSVYEVTLKKPSSPWVASHDLCCVGEISVDDDLGLAALTDCFGEVWMSALGREDSFDPHVSRHS
jgi:hypothetical protein